MTIDGIGPEPWESPEVQSWCQLLLDSYQRLKGRDLVDRTGTLVDQARALFRVPFVVASHGTEPDPVLNYGNQVALDLWEMRWEQFTQTSSRLTAEPENREERARMLEQAAAHGFIDDYRGIRISGTGRRFLVEQATVWNIVDGEGQKRGQAATFSKWTYLEE